MVESVIGCKWSLTVIDLVRRGVSRPGAMEHAIAGLSAKVLNERLVKLVRFGILDKTSYPAVPPRVEYRMTDFGREFVQLLDQVDQLEKRLGARRVDDVQHAAAATSSDRSQRRGSPKV